MTSHFDALGLAANDGPAIDTMIQRLMHHGEIVRPTPESQSELYLHQDPSGARVTITVVDGEVRCLIPSYVPATKLSARSGQLFDYPTCEFERPWGVEMTTDGGTSEPLAIVLEDMVLRRPPPLGTEPVEVEVSGIAEAIMFYRDEGEVEAFGALHAHRIGAPLPIGWIEPTVLNLQGDYAVGVQPRATICGRVTESQFLRHTIMGGTFAHMRVGLGTFDFDIVGELDELPIDNARQPMLPRQGWIAQGRVYLSGRVTSGALG